MWALRNNDKCGSWPEICKTQNWSGIFNIYLSPCHWKWISSRWQFWERVLVQQGLGISYIDTHQCVRTVHHPGYLYLYKWNKQIKKNHRCIIWNKREQERTKTKFFYNNVLMSQAEGTWSGHHNEYIICSSTIYFKLAV